MCLVATAFAQEGPKALLDEANAAFHEANTLAAQDPDAAKAAYGKAILRFERLTGDVGIRNGKLYYNLGNAYFLSGDIGRAILNYRRALQYLPNDPNLHQNLAYVRNQREDRIDEPQRAKVLETVFFWHYDLSSRARSATFALVFLALWGCASARLHLRRPAPGARRDSFPPREVGTNPALRGLNRAIVVFAALSVLLLGSVTADAVARARDASGVVLADEIVARKGNGETYQPSFQEPLHTGTEFALIENRDGWYNIELRDGRQCWIPESAAAMVAQ